MEAINETLKNLSQAKELFLKIDVSKALLSDNDCNDALELLNKITDLMEKSIELLANCST